MSLRRRIAWTWLAQAHANAITHSPAPFLYQTPTLLSLRSYSNTLRRDKQAETLKGWVEYEGQPRRHSFLRSKAASIRPTGFLKNRNDRSEAREGERKPRPPRKTRKTLTTNESRTLASLFEQLKPLEMKQSPYDPLQEPEAPEVIQAKKKERDEIYSAFDVIMEELQKPADSVADAKRREQAAAEATEQDGTMIVIPEDPKELKKLAWKHNVSKADQIELVIKREFMRVENALNDAIARAATTKEGGDKELWKVCQEMIFPMVHHLRSTEPSTSTPEPEPQPQTQTFTVEDDLDLDLDIENIKSAPVIPGEPFKVPSWLPAPIITAGVYPKSLRKAFNLLNVHYPDSDIIPSFRSAITSLGPESAMLGMSTGLYNDMMYFHWRVARDLTEVVAIGREMVLTGARVDQGTLGILDRIVLERNRHLRMKEQGKTSSTPWWDFPTNRTATRDLLGTGGLISKLKNQYRDMKKKKDMGRPFI
ncbi:hypothetical protein BDV19DRAFT_373618 [Aspergillus venezuelensis]